ncbi:hypothetical protein L3Y34_013136 [Caenorhabditis briggsae]|uniref:Uncharacterized protein n=1 Tax=Caenorhabditis briggsae TaxID=6238 RepID=A0AAE9A0W5_CAEBR|nr:hypothetical protein L3Y34_013136 [Caenorhabditis briggsae]
MNNSSSALTVTTQPEFTHGYPVLVTFYIGPTNQKGRHPAIARETLTPIMIFKNTWAELTKTLGRFFNKNLPLLIVGRDIRVKDNDDFITRMTNCRFLHRATGCYHILVRIYPDDISGRKARERLNDVAQELETNNSTQTSQSSSSTCSSNAQTFETSS